MLDRSLQSGGSVTSGDEAIKRVRLAEEEEGRHKVINSKTDQGGNEETRRATTRESSTLMPRTVLFTQMCCRVKNEMK